MDAIDYSWIGAAAVSPLTIVISICSIYIFHSYKKKWRTIDLFLVALTTLEMLCSIFVFIFALVNMINPRIIHICLFILWGLTGVRTMQILTLTSMAVDRAFTIKWPYKYRFSVRRNQIRYHISVLAFISIFVGVAAIFARHSSTGECPLLSVQAKFYGFDTCCSVYPRSIDMKFSIFIVSFYGFMTAATLIAILHIVIYKSRSRRRKSLQLPISTMPRPMPNQVLMPFQSFENHQIDDSIDSKLPQKCSSTRSANSDRFSMSSRYFGSLRSSTSTADVRWTSVIFVVVFCFAVNHAPFLVFSLLSLFTRSTKIFWTPVVENVITWLHLSEAILLPLLLLIVDSTYRQVVYRAIFKRNSHQTSCEDDKKFGGYQLEATNLAFTTKADVLSSHFPNMDMSGAPIIPNYRRKTDSRKQHRVPKLIYNNPLRVDIPCGVTASGLWATRRSQPSYIPNVYSIDQSDLVDKKDKYLHNSSASLTRLPSMESDLNKDSTVWDNKDDDDDDSQYDDDNHIYATVSEITAGTRSTLEAKHDSEAIYPLEIDNDDQGSCTTSANDDFEFHDRRFSSPMTGKGVTVITIGDEPTNGSYDTTEDDFRMDGPIKDDEDADDEDSLQEHMFSLSQEHFDDKDQSNLFPVIHQYNESGDADDEESLHELVLNLNKECRKKDELSNEMKTPKNSDELRLHVYRVNKDELTSAPENPLKPYYSMNDLDCITKGRDSKVSSGSDENIFVYPVRDESMSSSYNILFQEAKNPKEAVSELDLSKEPIHNKDFYAPKYRNIVTMNCSGDNVNPLNEQRRDSTDELKKLQRGHSFKNNLVTAEKITRNSSQKKTFRVSIVECNKKNQENNPPRVFSIDTLLDALNNSDISYLDNGDICQHGI